MPKIDVRFRKYKEVPFSIEKLSGVQYRCRMCNRVFLDKKTLMAHLETEAQQNESPTVHSEAPQIGQAVRVSVLYTQDVRDVLHKEFLKLAPNVTFDAEP